MQQARRLADGIGARIPGDLGKGAIDAQDHRRFIGNDHALLGLEGDRGDPQIGLGALALGDIDEAAADQPLADRRQPDQADFAAHQLSLVIADGAVEHHLVTGHRPLQHFLDDLCCGFPVVQAWRIESFHASGQQFLAAAAKEFLGLRVGIDEVAQIDVVHHDGVGRLLHQDAEAVFAFAQRACHLARQAQGAIAGGGQRPGDGKQQQAGQHAARQYLRRARHVA